MGTARDKALGGRLLKVLEGTAYGSLELETPEGARHRFCGRAEGADARLIIHDWHVVGELLHKGDIGFAETYRDGLWQTPDLPALLIYAQQNRARLARYGRGSLWAIILQRLFYALQRNSVRGAKRNIAAHYDLGNAFYRLWLDQSMTYSSALFAGQTDDLAQAQANKYDRILSRLNGLSGRVLEIGCGWGGFAERALSRGDYAVRGITISPAQHSFANKRLAGKADIVLEDYRAQSGLYDYIVSIEMIEAVGEKYWPVYFRQLKRLLKKGGKAVVQAITIDDRQFANYRRGADMIRTFIFPGGMLLSPARLRREAEKAGLAVKDYYRFGQDYTRTLRSWLTRFDSQTRALAALGFDDSFQRLWRFYLAVCISGFTTANTDVAQIQLEHAS